ncbi:MAG: AzlC family ABC transporter permease [Oscillospiraceae bacterium]|nr:AzlC family ABC transporter permease [Oscillospiraceae bacterium]
MTDTQPHFFRRGLLHGLPIGLGYLSVSFGFGIMAVRVGMSVFEATLISLLNLTSAGQAAGVNVIAAGGTLAEMALVQLTVNIRYALMALSLSQKCSPRFRLPQRLLGAHGITDEIFGVCAAQEGALEPPYLFGMTLISMTGWVLGTFLGAFAGSLLPASVTAALGILLYGMFLAIIVPPARKDRAILCTVLAAAALSVLCRYLLPALSEGFAVILCAVTAAAAAALLFPRPEEDAAEKGGRP